MPIDKNKVISLMAPYLPVVENKIKEDLRLNFEESPLKEACAYALLKGGKRFRPLITLLVSEALSSSEKALEAAVSIEYFHTASLIADDLPCMDDDSERRGVPTLHKQFDMGIALLASYALISAGYRLITENGKKRREALIPALDLISMNTGVNGAVYGQYLDLYGKNQTKEELLFVLNKKTVTLFEIAFGLGWLFGGGDFSLMEEVKKLSFHFGMAFQIADDIEDFKQDQHENNLAKLLGIEEAEKLLADEKREALASLEKLNICTTALQSLVDAIV